MATTTLICPEPTCRMTFVIGATFENVTFQGNATNLAVTCPRCGRTFDAAPADGTYSTIGGRLRRVADYIARSDIEELRSLRERLVRLEAALDVREATDALSAVGVPEPRGGWSSSQSNRMELLQILAVLLAALGVVLSLLPQEQQGLSPSDVEKIIREVSRPPGPR